MESSGEDNLFPSSGENFDAGFSWIQSFFNQGSGSYIFDLIKIALIAYFLFAVVSSLLNKGQVKPRFSGNNRERLYKRFIYSNYDVIRDLDAEENALLKVTFENTVINASTQKIKPPTLGKNSARRVRFHSDVKQQ